MAMLRDMLERRLEYARRDGERFFDAAAERARRSPTPSATTVRCTTAPATSWNLRDAHMFDTLQALLAFHGPGSKGVVWEHNSHVGNAARDRDERARRAQRRASSAGASFGQDAYIIGFGTDHGTVAAASNWDEPMQTMAVRPGASGELRTGLPRRRACPRSCCTCDDRAPAPCATSSQPPRLERAIGVVYRPESELASHYFYASLPHQFDEYVWFDETRAVRPLPAAAYPSADLPETYPFGL